MEIPDVALGVIVGVAVVLLLFSIIVVVVLLRKRCFNKNGSDHQHKSQVDVERAVVSPDRQLIEEDGEDDASISLDDVLRDDVWIDDMTGVMNHCIPILKGCHDLTSRLVPITREQCTSDQQSKQVEDIASKIEPALEGVVQLLDGPLDPRLVEARCTSLFYAVSSLCLIIKSICNEDTGVSEWIDTALSVIESHLNVLQSETQKLHRRSISSCIEDDCEPSPPTNGIALVGTRSNSRRTSSSHTDSTESGIDVHTPSERGSEYAPYSPTEHENKSSKKRHESEIDCHTIAEVQVHTGSVGSESTGEGIEMTSFTNGGYVEEASV